ncbi:unnamed protein product [Malus baccata var. baccata]
MEVESKAKLLNKKKSFSHSTVLIAIFLSSLFLILILYLAQPSPSFSPSLKLQNSVTFLPLKDTRFANTAMKGNTWFMSSLSDTYEENESEYLYFPLEASDGKLLCIKWNDISDGTRNSYALAYPEGLPNSTTFLKGLVFMSDTLYDYGNLWHGLTAMMPFVGWSMKNGCAKPVRLVLFHWGKLRVRERNGAVDSERPYCFEKAVVIGHNVGKMGKQKKLQVSDLLRCKVRQFCGINPNGRGRDVTLKGELSITLTLLMRNRSRSFKNPTAVINVFSRECAMVDGYTLEVVQSENLNLCDQLSTSDKIFFPHLVCHSTFPFIALSSFAHHLTPWMPCSLS